MANSREKLIQLLRSQREQAGLLDQGGGMAEVLAEWQADLAELMDRCEAWLEKLRAEGLLDYRRGEIQVEEYRLGKYQAPTLWIQSPTGRQVQVLPRGRLIVAAIGRVDLVAGVRRAALVRFDPGKWFFAAKPGPEDKIESLPLSEDSFAEILTELLS